jgi:hypothetical protein
MNRLLVRLYPASWQARYRDEFEALLEERPIGPFDVADILLSAFDAHLRRGGAAAAGGHDRGIGMTLRNGGIAATVGGGLWLVSLIGGSATRPDDGQPWIALIIVAMLALVVAIVGLSAAQGRAQPRLVWAVVALSVVGAGVALFGLVGMATVWDRPLIADVSGWNLWVLGTIATIVGSGGFGLANLRMRTLSRVGSGLLMIGAAAALPILFGVASSDGFGAVGSIIALLGIFAFAAGWIWLGISAIRTDRAETAGLREALP